MVAGTTVLGFALAAAGCLDFNAPEVGSSGCRAHSQGSGYADVEPPRIVATDPGGGSEGVSPSLTRVNFDLSEEVTADSVLPGGVALMKTADVRDDLVTGFADAKLKVDACATGDSAENWSTASGAPPYTPGLPNSAASDGSCP